MTLTDGDLERLLAGAARSFDVPHDSASGLLSQAAPVTRPRERSWALPAAAAVVALLLLGGIGLVGLKPGAGPGGATSASSGVTDASSGEVSKGRPAVGAPQPATGLAKGQQALPGSGAGPLAIGDSGSSRVVKTGTLVLAVEEGQVSATVTAATRAAQAVGGYVQDGSTAESGDAPTGHLVLRAPAARYEELVAAVRRLPGRVVTASTSGQDVSAQYTDLVSQLESLRAARSRFLAILAKAKTVSEVLAVQQRVDDVTTQIDQVEGQRRLLGSQSDLATLDVTVSESGDVSVAPARSGLSKAFADARDGFVSGVEALVRVSGPLLLVVLVLGVLALGGHAVYRMWRRRLL